MSHILLIEDDPAIALTALRTDLEMASQTGQSFPVLVERALAQADRLQALVDNLLNLSRIEAHENMHSPVDLAVLVQETGELFASQAEQAGLSFALEGVESSAQVMGNEAQLRSAIGNLIENAIKFTPEKGQIGVGLKADDDGWQVWVEDNGVGIPPEEIPHLFQRFHRGRHVSDFPGNGLGLAIVKAIADAHEGRVAVENLNPGARFSIWIPK
ncbi:MAG TPA: HAMP domain-containing sensor histidine kinase [Anaerolineales bacterium]|nr:HAMP domain-containing sensor histidine kinase [Anaerolineales bacterium]